MAQPDLILPSLPESLGSSFTSTVWYLPILPLLPIDLLPIPARLEADSPLSLSQRMSSRNPHVDHIPIFLATPAQSNQGFFGFLALKRGGPISSRLGERAKEDQGLTAILRSRHRSPCHSSEIQRSTHNLVPEEEHAHLASASALRTTAQRPPRTHFAPGRSCVLPPRTKTTARIATHQFCELEGGHRAGRSAPECSCRLWPSPGM